MTMHVKIANVINVAGEFSIYLKSNAIFSSTDSKERKVYSGAAHLGVVVVVDE